MTKLALEKTNVSETLTPVQRRAKVKELTKKFAFDVVDTVGGIRGDACAYDVIDDMYTEIDRAGRLWKKMNTPPRTPEQIAAAKVIAEKKAATAKRRKVEAAMRKKINDDVARASEAAMITTAAGHLCIEVSFMEELVAKKKILYPYWALQQLISEIIVDRTKLPG